MMRFLKFVFIAIIILIAVPIIAFIIYYGSDYYEWRQKISLSVVIADKTISRSVVHGVSIEKARNSLGYDGPDFHASLTGEAAIIELPDSQKLFLLIGNSASLLPRILLPNQGWGSKESLQLAESQKIGFSGTVPRNYYPLLVTFTDINDPKTVMRVDPDDMDAVLGCSKPQLAKDFPWRAQGRTWRQWHKFEAYREAILNAGEEAGLPADYSRYAALEKLNGAFNNGIVKENEPRYMPPPKGYEADKLQLASMWSAIRAKYGKSSLREMYRQHRITAARLRKTYLERGRDTVNDCHRLKSLTLEITDEPVTKGEVDKVLGWLGEYYSNRFDGKRFGTVKTDFPFANSLASGAFDTEK